jgi:coenzyme F420-0:L-glutamate ligase/coenzyme F420-1:gamma-L-glutamate ligase
MRGQAKLQKLSLLTSARVGHLATVDAEGKPYIVPVVFACDGHRIYIALDSKKKSASVERLKRVRNILENPRVAMIVDHYAEQWEELEYILIHGTATLLKQGKVHEAALDMLKAKYPQYQCMPLDKAPVICINPERWVCWTAIDRH